MNYKLFTMKRAFLSVILLVAVVTTLVNVTQPASPKAASTVAAETRRATVRWCAKWVLIYAKHGPPSCCAET